MKIAFIGLGNMGGPMARNLLKAGHALTVFDVVERNVEALTALGAAGAGSAKLAAAAGELVITMLPSSPHVKSVYLGDDGVLAGVRRGVTLVDSSTIDPHSAREVAAAAAAHGNPMADAPVSGGTGGAEAGTLTFMVGADPALFDTIKPTLAHMGKNIVHCGGAGTGQVAKICNNMLLGISMVGVAEAMNLGAALGIDPKVLAGIINTSSGRCWSSDTVSYTHLDVYKRQARYIQGLEPGRGGHAGHIGIDGADHLKRTFLRQGGPETRAGRCQRCTCLLYTSRCV